jgi:hypothetical protein
MSRSDPPLVGDERELLVGWLDFHRETLALKCSGLSTEQLAYQPISSSSLSLGGLLRHLAEIERTYFGRVFAGLDLDDLPFGDDPFYERDGSFLPSAPGSPEEPLLEWRGEVERSRRIVRGSPSLDDCGHSGLSLRFWLVKTLNEYARHNGHADLLRELIDGTTGE